jgi:hypothetical protein
MKRTLIAAAVLSTMAAGSAYAGCTAGCDPAELFTATNVYTDIGEYGFITLRGKVDVSSSNGATVNNTQNVNVGSVDMKTPPQSYTSGNVTTGIHTNDSWNNASGGGSGGGYSQSYSTSGYAYNNTNSHTSTTTASGSFAAGGGFAAGVAGASQSYSYSNTHASANGVLTAGLIADIRGGRGVIVGGSAEHPRVGKRRRGLRSSSGRLRRDIRWLCSQQHKHHHQVQLWLRGQDHRQLLG